MKISAEVIKDGTLIVYVPDGSVVNRVVVWGENHMGDLFYPEREEDEDDLR